MNQNERIARAFDDMARASVPLTNRQLEQIGNASFATAVGVWVIIGWHALTMVGSILGAIATASWRAAASLLRG